MPSSRARRSVKEKIQRLIGSRTQQNNVRITISDLNEKKPAPWSNAERIAFSEWVMGIRSARSRRGFGSVVTGNNVPVMNHIPDPNSQTKAEPF